MLLVDEPEYSKLTDQNFYEITKFSGRPGEILDQPLSS
jgi:hypothetical protein